MSDFINTEQRSQLMAKVRNRNTKPERQIRSGLHRLGFRFRIHVKEIPGTPDIVLKKYNCTIFIHGCFWHGHKGCKKASLPKTRKEFWKTKINRNIERDKTNYTILKDKGWRIVIVWECATKNLLQLDTTFKILAEWLPTKNIFLEIP